MSEVYNVESKRMSLILVNYNGGLGLGGGLYEILTEESLEALIADFSEHRLQIIKSSITNNSAIVNVDWVSTIQTVYVSEFDSVYFYTRDKDNCKCVKLEYNSRPYEGIKWFKYEGL